MRKKELRFILSVILLTFSVITTAQNPDLPVNKLFGRIYATGERYRYKMTMSEYHNGEFQLTNISICELKVIDSAGVPYDEIHWISKIVIHPKDTVDQTSSAILIKPYRVSLAGKGRIDLPKVDVSEMTEPIQDFNTFFVAVSPQLEGINRLNKTGDSISVKSLIKADFSNGSSVLKGEDCFLIRAWLINSDKKTVQVRTSFMTPDTSCLAYLIRDMNTPVFENSRNNFQMVSPSGTNQFNVSYGREYFYINSTIRKSDGKVLKADMFNQLNLKIKINCDPEYKNCQTEVPFFEKRVLALELISQ